MKSKSYILIVLLTVFSFKSNAQSLTLEQTVDYITVIIKSGRTFYWPPLSNSLYNINGVKVEKTGRITFQFYSEVDKSITTRGSFNVFDLESSNWTSGGILELKNKEKTNLGSVDGLSSYEDAKRLFRAIMHLKNVCTKSADPFGN